MTGMLRNLIFRILGIGSRTSEILNKNRKMKAEIEPINGSSERMRA